MISDITKCLPYYTWYLELKKRTNELSEITFRGPKKKRKNIKHKTSLAFQLRLLKTKLVECLL